MEKRWLFSLFCFISVPSITAQSLDVITETEVVHARPGSDTTLMCIFPKLHTTYIIQTQWSKTDDSQSTKIAVYHPTYGTHYFKFSEASYNFSVSFSTRKRCSQDVTESLGSANPNIAPECNQWTLHLKNVTVSLSGQYKCSFATYPYGTKAAKIQLIVKAEEEQHYLKEVWLNQTLEIPCLEDTTSENLSTYPLKWLVSENGTKEELVTKEPSCPAVYRNSSALYGQRVFLGLNNALKIFPTKITDDNRVFSCHVMHHPERVQKSSTTVRVFAYPEISVGLQEGSVGTSQKPSVVCVVRRAFPKPTLMWYMDRVNLVEQHRDNKSNEASSEAFATTVAEDLGDSTVTPVVVTASGDGRSTKASHFPWPTVVAVLLLFCSSLIALGIRKWCQYQNEIMSRPPSFKPPPPPIKYISMVESDGTPPSCHELENL